MSELKKLQKNFALHLRDKNKTQILKNIPYEKQEALERLQIYRNNVFGAFESVLNAIFPVTKKILGQKKFAEYVKIYCQKFDSKSGNLDDYGENFAQLFKQHKIAYLADLAHLELKYYRAYFAEDVKQIFDIENFKKIAPQKFFDLFFELNPSLELIESDFALYEIWHGKKTDTKKSQLIAIVRGFDEVVLHNLNSDEFMFLSLIIKGWRLYDIYQEICKKNNKEIDIGALINRFIHDRIIVGYKI